MKKMMKWKKDVLYSVIISLFSGLFIAETAGMNDSLMEYVPSKAGVYTRFWLYLLIAFCVIVAVRAIIKRDKTETESCLNAASMVTIAALAAYVLALDYLGFLVSTVIYLFGSMVYYTWKAKKFVDEEGNKLPRAKLVKSIALMLVGSVVVTFATYYLFTEAVGMMLPEWNLW